jgi:hypothetical protein
MCLRFYLWRKTKLKAEKQRKAKKQRGREKQKSRKTESEKLKKANGKTKTKKNSPPSKVVLSLRPIMSTKNRDFVGILAVQLCSGWGNLS